MLPTMPPKTRAESVHVYQLDDSRRVQQRVTCNGYHQDYKALEENHFRLYSQQVAITQTPDRKVNIVKSFCAEDELAGKIISPMAFISILNKLMHLIDCWVISRFCLSRQQYPETWHCSEVQNCSSLYAVNLSQLVSMMNSLLIFYCRSNLRSAVSHSHQSSALKLKPLLLLIWLKPRSL